MTRLAPGEQKPQLRRQRRPGQVPPSSRSTNTGSHKRARGADYSGQASSTEGTNGDPQENQKMAQQAAEFDARRPANIEQYFLDYEKSTAFTFLTHVSISEELRKQAELILDSNKKEHPCCASGSPTDCLMEVKRSTVVVVDFDHRFTLSLPILKCRQCAKIVTVHPYSVDCVPTAPTENCETWIRRSVAHFFRDLHKNNGLSANGKLLGIAAARRKICKNIDYCITKLCFSDTIDIDFAAFIHALDNSERRFIPGGSTFQVGDGDTIVASLKAEQLVVADIEAWKVESAAEEEILKPLGEDPFVNCPVCATSTRETLTDGRSVPPVRLSIMTDAMNAADRFASAGRSQANVKPTTYSYLGDAAEKVMEETKAGTLVSAAKQSAAAAVNTVADASEDALHGLGGCTTALHCNRELARPGRGEMHIKGTVAIVCSHVFPGMGCCLPMTVPECHHFYDLLLEYLLRVRPDTKDVYLDLMCRYATRFKGLIARLSSEGVFPTSDPDITMLLPMMHAFDHNHQCQLKFSALYASGVGRRVGEQTEVLWSCVKAFFKIARYMTFAHWWDSYNCLLYLLSRRKQERFPAMLQSRIKRIDAKRVDFTIAISNLRLEAQSHGVDDLDRALQSLQTSGNGNGTSLSLGAKYVEVLRILKSLHSIADHKAIYPIFMPGNTGIHIQGAVLNDESKQKYKRLLGKLQTQLNLPLGEDWAEDSQEYKAALQELSEYYTKHYAREIENQVFKRKQIQQAAQQVQSGNNGSKIEKRLQANKKNIEGLLQCYYNMEVLGTETPCTVLTEERLRQVCGGVLPWSTAALGPNGSSAAQNHFALRYQAAKNQLDRTVEEVEMLKNEVVRLFNWCEEREEEVGETIQFIDGKVKELEELNEEILANSEDSLINKRRIGNLLGKKCMLSMEALRLKYIHNEVKYRLR